MPAGRCDVDYDNHKLRRIAIHQNRRFEGFALRGMAYAWQKAIGEPRAVFCAKLERDGLRELRARAVGPPRMPARGRRDRGCANGRPEK